MPQYDVPLKCFKQLANMDGDSYGTGEEVWETENQSWRKFE